MTKELATAIARTTLKTAVWELLWLLERASGEGDWKWVNNGSPVDSQQLTTDLGTTRSVTYANLRLLEGSGLIRRKRIKKGVIIEVFDGKLSQVLSPKSLYIYTPSVLEDKKNTENSVSDFSTEAQSLVKVLYKYLSNQNAAPLGTKYKQGWWVRNLQVADKELLPSREVSYWLECFEWMKNHPRWSLKLTTLNALLWAQQEYELARNRVAPTRERQYHPIDELN